MSDAFIAVEGRNGVGKTTIAKLLATRLHARTAAPVHLTTEPTHTPLGQLLRRSESTLYGRRSPWPWPLTAPPTSRRRSSGAGRRPTCHHRPLCAVLARPAGPDGLDLREIWSYNRYVLPATTFDLEDYPAVIAARLAQRPSLTRLELTGTPGRELQLYRKAFAFLRREDWPQHAIDCRGKDPDRVVADILDHIDP